MSSPMAISCPHCGAGLKLKNNSFVGRKVPCPKCKHPFLVEEPPEDEFLSGEDDFGSMDEPEDEPEEPRSKSKAKGGKGKKKSKSGGGASIALIGGGAVLGLGLLGGIIYGAMALFSGMGGSNSWVKWLPDDTDVAIQVRVADSMNAPFFKPIMDNPTLSKLMNQPAMGAAGGSDPATAFFQGLSIQAKDVETLTVGVVNGIGSGVNTGFSGTQTPSQFVAVVRLKTPVEEAKLAQAPSTVLAKEDYNGKSVYAVVSSANPKVLVYSVDATTYLVGSDAELKAAIDSQGAAPAGKRYSFVNTNSSFVFASAPKDISKLKSLGVSSFRVSSSGTQQESSNIQGIHGVSYGVILGADAQVEFRSSVDSSGAQLTADQGKKDIDKARSDLQAQIAQLDAAPFNPLMPKESVKKLMGHLEKMLGSAQSTASGSTTNLTMTLSGQIVSDGLQMAAPYMPMLEAMVAQQQKAAAASAQSPMMSSPMGMPGAPGFGSSPMDVTAYPGAVIDAGEKSKSKIADMGDKHNAELEAQMQEGGAMAAHAAPASAAGGDGQDQAAMQEQMRKQMQGAGAPGAAPEGGGLGGDQAQMMSQQDEMRNRMQGASAPGGAPDDGDQAQRMSQQEEMRKRMQGGGAAPAGNPNNQAAMQEQMRQGMQGGAGQAPAAEGEKTDKPASKSRSRRKTGK